MNYKESGVDIDAGNKLVGNIAKLVSTTYTKNILGGIGGFNGLFKADIANMEDPIFSACTDGVGTKLKVAFALNKHDTVGIDLVAMSVNDLIVSGCKPLVFLDYLACGKLSSINAEEIIKGIVDGCQQSDCALLGGETAEMPGFYSDGEYDLAGFAIGVVDRSKIIDGSKISKGDLIVGIGSSGLHSNGYSLARKLLADYDQNELLIPTKIYVKVIHNILQRFDINGLVHITGGGLIDNPPRIIPKGLKASFFPHAWDEPKIFGEIRCRANISEEEMMRTFNMGLGMLVILPFRQAVDAVKAIKSYGENAWLVGSITEQNEDIRSRI